MMYHVAKSPNGRFVGTRTAQEITTQFHAGKILGDYVVTPSSGPAYRDVAKQGTAVWTQISDFVAALALVSEVSTAGDEQARGATPFRAPFTSAPSRREVVITDIRMPFESMVVFMVKWAIASIPAFAILFIIRLFLHAIFQL